MRLLLIIALLGILIPPTQVSACGLGTYSLHLSFYNTNAKLLSNTDLESCDILFTQESGDSIYLQDEKGTVQYPQNTNIETEKFDPFQITTDAIYVYNEVNRSGIILMADDTDAYINFTKITTEKNENIGFPIKWINDKIMLRLNSLEQFKNTPWTQTDIAYSLRIQQNIIYAALVLRYRPTMVSVNTVVQYSLVTQTGKELTELLNPPSEFYINQGALYFKTLNNLGNYFKYDGTLEELELEGEGIYTALGLGDQYYYSIETEFGSKIYAGSKLFLESEDTVVEIVSLNSGVAVIYKKQTELISSLNSEVNSVNFPISAVFVSIYLLRKTHIR